MNQRYSKPQRCGELATNISCKILARPIPGDKIQDRPDCSRIGPLINTNEVRLRLKKCRQLIHWMHKDERRESCPKKAPIRGPRKTQNTGNHPRHKRESLFAKKFTTYAKAFTARGPRDMRLRSVCPRPAARESNFLLRKGGGPQARSCVKQGGIWRKRGRDVRYQGDAPRQRWGPCGERAAALRLIASWRHRHAPVLADAGLRLVITHR